MDDRLADPMRAPASDAEPDGAPVDLVGDGPMRGAAAVASHDGGADAAADALGTAPSTALDGGPIVDLDALDGALIAARYQVAQIVSLGSNTVIVDAHDTRAPEPFSHPVTIKVVRPHLAARPDFHHKFRVLADLSQALTHPNISSVLDWGEIEIGPADDRRRSVFWVLDAFGGGSLRDLMDRGRTLTPSQALVVGLEACRALDAAHQRGLFHTELTPSKMVFGADRRLRLVDFGLARLLAERTWEDPATVPTDIALYASPEQAIGVPIDATTDVYALALVLVEAVTGQVPFAADSTVATLAGRVDRLLPVSADLGALAAVLERAGRPEAADRYSAAEFGRALVQIAGKLPRPEPMPVLSTGMLDSTGDGIRRPPSAAVDAAVGSDEPQPDGDDAADAAVAAATIAAAAGVAVAAGTGLATAVGPDADGSEVDTGAAEASTGDDVAEAGASAGDTGAAEASTGDDATGEAPAAGGDALSGTPIEEEVDEQPLVAAELVDEPEEGAPTAVATDVPPAPATEAGDDAAITASTGDLRFTDEALVAATVTVPAAPTTQMPVESVPAVADNAAAAPYDEAPDRRRRGPIVLAAVVLIAGLAALGYAATLLFQPNSFAVPVLAGQPSDRALNQIAGNGWEVSFDFERSDSFPEPEQVIRTDPEPGAELEEGEPFLIVLSQGPEFRVLPEVAELPFDEAAGQLAALGLNAAEATERVFSETIPPGDVVSWQVVGDATLVAGAQILPGETVQLTLSRGPEPRVVPPLDGLTLDDAVAQADALRLRVVSGDGVFSDDVPEGLVVSQSPAPGESLERDGTITVQLSLGPDVVALPPLDGLTFAEAQTLLTENGS